MWTGVLTEFSETAKKRKYRGQSGGHKATFYVDKEEAPIPLNETVHIDWIDNSFTPPDAKEPITLKNVTNWWLADKLPQDQQAHMDEIATPPAQVYSEVGPGNSPVQDAPLGITPDFGYMDIGGKIERTMPTVKEQMVKEWVAAFIMCGKTQPNVQSISDTMKIVEQAYETGQIQNYPRTQNPPASAPVYGTGGTTAYDDRNPPPPDYTI